MPEPKGIRLEDGRAVSQYLGLRQDMMDTIRTQMQTGFAQLSKEMAGLRASQSEQSNAHQKPMVALSGEETTITTGQIHDVSNPPVGVILQPGAKLVINNVINNNVTVDLSAHSTVENHTTTSIPISATIAGDGIIESLGKMLGELFKV